TESKTIQRLRSMLPGTAASKVRSGKENIGALETLVIQGMCLVRAIGILASVIKGVLAQPVEGHAFHEPRGNDAIRIDIRSRNINGSAGDLGNFLKGHGGGTLREKRQESKMKDGAQKCAFVALRSTGWMRRSENRHDWRLSPT